MLDNRVPSDTILPASTWRPRTDREQGGGRRCPFQEHFVANSISLDDLVALNDEIAGLVRAGVPLEIGLASWGRDLPGELGRTASRLGESIAQGQSLSESFAAQGDRIPRVYTALVTAGLRSGRLPAALESLTTTARSLQGSSRRHRTGHAVSLDSGALGLRTFHPARDDRDLVGNQTLRRAAAQIMVNDRPAWASWLVVVGPDSAAC